MKWIYNEIISPLLFLLKYIFWLAIVYVICGILVLTLYAVGSYLLDYHNLIEALKC